jgi:hypothetical protein
MTFSALTLFLSKVANCDLRFFMEFEVPIWNLKRPLLFEVAICDLKFA